MRGPALLPGVMLIEQVYRNETSFVIKDPVTRKYFRFRPPEAAVIRTFDGTRTVEEIAAVLAEAGMAISATAIDGFARTLSRMGLLQRSLAERTGHQLERLRTERRRQRSLFRGEWTRMRWAFPASDPFFTWGLRYLRWCFTPGFVLASGGLFAAYFWLIGRHWDAFSAAVSSTYAPGVIGLDGVAIVITTFFVLTLIHELGHGFTCKYFGGEVHELGFMLLYFSPAFYCNVNDAWSFPTVRSRLWVTAAGTWIELVFTSLAMVVWVVARPDTFISDVAVAAVLIGGFSALLTNANPLLPLDGYFALADYLEIPNLRHRAAAHLAWWVKRHVLRLELPEPDVAPQDRRLFLGYGALSALYSGFFLSVIAVGVLGWTSRIAGLAGGLLAGTVILALLWGRITTGWNGIVLAVRARSGGARWRSWRRWAPLAGLAALIIAALIPWNLQANGGFTVAPVRSLAVVATDSAMVAEVYPSSGTVLEAGAPVARLLDLGLSRTLARTARTADSLSALVRLAQAAGQAGADVRLTAEGVAARARADAVRGRVAQEVVRSRIGGTVVTLHPEWLLGRQVGPGDTLVLVHDLTALEARIELTQAGSAAVQPGQRVRLIAYQAMAEPFEGVIRSVAPAGGGHPFGAIEARVALPAGVGLHAGASGEARVAWRRSTLLGALWWSVRSRIRSSLLL